MAIIKINHHTFTVSDMDASIHFYRDILGFHLVKQVMRENVPAYDQAMDMKDVRVNVAMFMDPADESMLTLLQYHHPQPQKRLMGNQFVGTSILAMKVTDY